MILLPTAKHRLFFISMLTIILTSACSEPSLRIGVTTTLEDSGLLQRLSTAFENDHAIKLNAVVVGSGQLFNLIRRGDIDIAISHEPQGETVLLSQGIIEKRTPLFYNHFVIIGPSHDPAEIHHIKTAKDALHKIQQTKHDFISRGDYSGTHKMELSLRTQNNPSFITSTGTGMGATLAVAIERNAYALVDKASWLHFANPQQHTILWENSATLLNPYHLLILPSQTPHARKLEQWLTSEKVHTLVENYQLHGEKLFYTHNP